MAWLRRLRAETAVEDGVRRGRRARLRVSAHHEKRCTALHWRLDQAADKDRNEWGNLRSRMIGVLGIRLTMAHAERLLAVKLRGALILHIRHIGTTPHAVHCLQLRGLPDRTRACRAGIGGRCQLN